MEFWTFVFACVLISAVAKLVKSALDNDRDTRVAKVEAELKLKLVDRLQDPELVRRVVEARLPRGKSVDDHVEDAQNAPAACSPGVAERSGTKAGEEGRWYVLGGLICFLVGLAFIVASQVVGESAFILPGAICSAVGLALLTFATSQKQIRRHIGEESAATE